MISYGKITGYTNKKEGVKCMICNRYYFKDKFNCQPYVCIEFHEFSMTVMDLSDFFVLTIKGNDYRVYISNIDGTYFRDIYSNREINRWKIIFNRFAEVLKSKS